MHRHRPDPKKAKTLGYCGYSVRPAKPNQKAHGGVTHYDYCKCGAKRLTNSTGAGRDERGPWVEAEATP